MILINLLMNLINLLILLILRKSDDWNESDDAEESSDPGESDDSVREGGCNKSREDPGIAKIGLTPPPPPNLGTLVDFTTNQHILG